MNRIAAALDGNGAPAQLDGDAGLLERTRGGSPDDVAERRIVDSDVAGAGAAQQALLENERAESE